MLIAAICIVGLLLVAFCIALAKAACDIIDEFGEH